MTGLQLGFMMQVMTSGNLANFQSIPQSFSYAIYLFLHYFICENDSRDCVISLGKFNEKMSKILFSLGTLSWLNFSPGTAPCSVIMLSHQRQILLLSGLTFLQSLDSSIVDLKLWDISMTVLQLHTEFLIALPYLCVYSWDMTFLRLLPQWSYEGQCWFHRK